MRISAALTALIMLSTAGLRAEVVMPRLPSLSQVRAELARQAPKRDTLRVWLEIRRDSDDGFEIRDPFLRIRFDADTFDGRDYRFWGRADQEPLSFRGGPSFADEGDADILGGGLSLRLEESFGWKTGYTLRGTVNGEGYAQTVDLELEFREGWDAYFIEGPGVDLRLETGSRLEISGTIKPGLFGKKALSGLAAAAVMILRSRDEPERPGRLRDALNDSSGEDDVPPPPEKPGPFSESSGED